MNVDVATGQDNWLNATQIGGDVDEACDRFEAAWRAGDRPRIEDFLGGATDADRPVRAPSPSGRGVRLPRPSRGVSRAVGISMSVPRTRRADRLGLR